MKLINSISILVVMLLSCNSSKTVFISNKTGSPITLLVDSSYNSNYPLVFKDSLDGLSIEKKKVLDFGKGKWTKQDKTSLEELLKHTKIIKYGSSTPIDLPDKTSISHISFNVEELWVNIK